MLNLSSWCFWNRYTCEVGSKFDGKFWPWKWTL